MRESIQALEAKAASLGHDLTTAEQLAARFIPPSHSPTNFWDAEQARPLTARMSSRHQKAILRTCD